MEDKSQKGLKLAIFVALLGGIGYFVIPIITAMAINLVTIALCGLALFGIWMFLPSISEALAQLSYRLWEMVIRADPVAKLRRELEVHAAQIRQMENRIAEANASVYQFKILIREEGDKLSPEQKSNWEDQIAMLIQAGKELIKMRDQAVTDHGKFKLEVEKAETELKIGKAFKSVLGAFAFTGNKGATSAGARVALDEVQKQLSSSQAKLQLVLSRQLMSVSGVPATPQLSAR